MTSGGTIPDRGLYGVYLAGGSDGPERGDDVPVDAERTAGRLRGGRRVGELDEEMVYESRVGDTFTLGSSTWRIEDITPDRVLVTPAPGLPGRLPFWKGDSPGRPAELGSAMGAWVRGADRHGRRPPRAPRSRGPGSTPGQPTTCSATWPSSARPPATCPPTVCWSSNGSATSWATGGSSCTRRTEPGCTHRGPW